MEMEVMMRTRTDLESRLRRGLSGDVARLAGVVTRRPRDADRRVTAAAKRARFPRERRGMVLEIRLSASDYFSRPSPLDPWADVSLKVLGNLQEVPDRRWVGGGRKLIKADRRRLSMGWAWVEEVQTGKSADGGLGCDGFKFSKKVSVTRG
jgi:hypothetical protein